MMRPESKMMKDLLEANGITGWNIKYIATGSMKGCFRLHERNTEWTEELRSKLNAIGIVNYDNKEIHRFASNGPILQIFVKVPVNVAMTTLPNEEV